MISCFYCDMQSDSHRAYGLSRTHSYAFFLNKPLFRVFFDQFHHNSRQGDEEDNSHDPEELPTNHGRNQRIASRETFTSVIGFLPRSAITTRSDTVPYFSWRLRKHSATEGSNGTVRSGNSKFCVSKST